MSMMKSIDNNYRMNLKSVRILERDNGKSAGSPSRSPGGPEKATETNRKLCARACMLVALGVAGCSR